MTIPDSTRDDKYDEHLDEAEEEQMLEKYKQERQDEMFPDEVDTPRDQLARTRYSSVYAPSGKNAEQCLDSLVFDFVGSRSTGV